MEPGEIQFGPFRFRPAEARVEGPDGPLRLTPKALSVLQYLASRPGRLVAKEEVLGAVWSGVHVSESVLKVCVREIRAALGDDARMPRYVETVHRRGYRFLAVEPDPPPLAPPAVTSLVGRDGEMLRLVACLDRARAGRRQTVFVTGASGAGKTALVEALLRRAGAASGSWVACGQSLERYGAGEPYMPVLEALGRLARGRTAPALGELLRRRAPTWLVQMPWLVGDSDRRALQTEILGATRERMLREIAEAFESLPAGVSLVVCLEDLHWSDPATLDVVSYLARRPEPARLMLLATYSPHEAARRRHPLRALMQDLSARGLGEEVVLKLLPQGAVEDYLALRLPSLRHRGPLAGAIHARTEGSPLFMVNVVDYLESRIRPGLQAGADDIDVLLEAIGSEVPDSLRRLIEKQIDELPPADRRLLEACSVAGVEFSALAVAEGMGTSLERVEEVCDRLARRGPFLRAAGARRLPDGTLTARYAFNHSLLQNVLYARLTASRRLRLHRRVARGGVAVFGGRVGEIAAELALRFEESRQYRAAVTFHQEAAAVAWARRGHREALRHLETALALLLRLPRSDRAARRIELLGRIGGAHRTLGDMSRAARAFRAQAAAARKRGLIGAEVRALHLLASALSWTDTAACLTAARRVVKAGRRAKDPLVRERARACWSYWHAMLSGWPADGAVASAAAVEAERAAPDPGALGDQLLRHSFLLSLCSRYAEAAAAAREGVRHALESGESFDHLLGQFFLGWALLHAGQWGEASSLAEEGRRMAERNGHLLWAGLFSLQKAWLLLEAGDPAGAAALCDPSIEQARRLRHATGEMIGLTLKGRAALGLDDVDSATRLFAEAPRSRRGGAAVMVWVWEMPRRLGLSECWRRRGAAERARAEALRARDLAARCPERTMLARACLAAARAARAGGDRVRERADLEAALEALSGCDAPLAEWEVRADVASRSAAWGRSFEASKHAARCVEVIESLAGALAGTEDLRATFLSSAAVRAALSRGARE